MAGSRGRFHLSGSELFVALRFKVRASGISRVNTVVLECDLLGAIPDIEAKVPLTVAVITDASSAEALGGARFWEGFEERAWRRLSPRRHTERARARREEFRRRLRAGEMAVAALHEGAWVGAAWFCLKGEKEDPVIESTVTLRPGEALLYQSQVDKALRGNRIYSKIVAEGLTHLRSEGFSQVRVHIEEDNLPSITAVETLGFRPVRLIRFRRLFSRVRREEVDLDASA